VTDIFNDGLAAPALMMAESYARLMRRLVEMSPEVLLNAYDELIDCATTDADGSPNAIERLAEMAIRQAETFHAVVRDVAATRLDSIVSGTYSRSSLLGLALTPKEPRKREGWHLPLAEEVVLTDSEAKEAERQNFKAAVPIIITGEVVPRTSNVVEIGGRRVTLPDADFRLFLRLVVQLFIGGDGYCRKGGGRQAGGLVGEGVVPDDVDNAVSRLRRSLQLGFLELAPKDYIEVQRGHGVRLSTHRRYVKVDRDALARHNNPAIRELAARLPML
jgi:hypothetical protein